MCVYMEPASSLQLTKDILSQHGPIALNLLAGNLAQVIPISDQPHNPIYLLYFVFLLSAPLQHRA